MEDLLKWFESHIALGLKPNADSLKRIFHDQQNKHAFLIGIF